VAIRIENLSKCYQIYGNPRDRLKQFVAPKFAKTRVVPNAFTEKGLYNR
jgi:lipopolysaccharide transport system ATP-binding protein